MELPPESLCADHPRESTATAATGLIVRSKVYTAAGLLGMAGTAAIALWDFYLKQLPDPQQIDCRMLNNEILIFAAIFVVMMVIPEHIINRRSRHEKQEPCSRQLNPLLHSELRLAVMSVLIGVESADFVFLRQQTGATAGNLSVQLDKLAKAGYIDIEKTFRGRMPCTLCRITDAGRDAFAEYVEALQSYIKR